MICLREKHLASSSAISDRFFSYRFLFSAFSRSSTSRQWFPRALAHFSSVCRLLLSAHLLLAPSPALVSEVLSQMDLISVSASWHSQEPSLLASEKLGSTAFSLESFSTKPNKGGQQTVPLQRHLGFLADLESFLRAPESNLGVILSTLVDKYFPPPGIKKSWSIGSAQNSFLLSLEEAHGGKEGCTEIKNVFVARGCSPERFAAQLLRLRSDLGLAVKERALTSVCRDQASLRRSVVAFLAAAESRTRGVSVSRDGCQDNAEVGHLSEQSRELTSEEDWDSTERGGGGAEEGNSPRSLVWQGRTPDEVSPHHQGVQAEKGSKTRKGQQCGGRAEQEKALKQVSDSGAREQADALLSDSDIHGGKPRRQQGDTVVDCNSSCKLLRRGSKRRSLRQDNDRDIHDRVYKSGSGTEDERPHQKESILGRSQAVETTATRPDAGPFSSLPTTYSPISGFLPTTSTTTVGASSPSDSAGLSSLSLSYPSRASCTVACVTGAAAVAPSDCSWGGERRTEVQASQALDPPRLPRSAGVAVECSTNSTSVSERSSVGFPSSSCDSVPASSLSTHRSASSCGETVCGRGGFGKESEQQRPAEVARDSKSERPSNEALEEATGAGLERRTGTAGGSPTKKDNTLEINGSSPGAKEEKTVNEESVTDKAPATEAAVEVRANAGSRNLTQPRRTRTGTPGAAVEDRAEREDAETDSVEDIVARGDQGYPRNTRGGANVLGTFPRSGESSLWKDGGFGNEERTSCTTCTPSAATPIFADDDVQDVVKGGRDQQGFRLATKHGQRRRSARAKLVANGRLGEGEAAEELAAAVPSQEGRHSLTNDNSGEWSAKDAADGILFHAERGARLRRSTPTNSRTHRKTGEMTLLRAKALEEEAAKSSSCMGRRGTRRNKFRSCGGSQGLEGERNKHPPAIASLRGYVWHVSSQALPAGAAFSIADVLSLSDPDGRDNESVSTLTRSSSFGMECFVPLGLDTIRDQREEMATEELSSACEDGCCSGKWETSDTGRHPHGDVEFARKWWRLDGTLLRIFDSRAELLSESVIDVHDICRIDADNSGQEDLSSPVDEERSGSLKDLQGGSEIACIPARQRERRAGERLSLSGNQEHPKFDMIEDDCAFELNGRIQRDQRTLAKGMGVPRCMRAVRQRDARRLRSHKGSPRASSREKARVSRLVDMEEDAFASTETVAPDVKVKDGAERGEEVEQEDVGETLWQALGYAWIDGAADRLGATARWKLTLVRAYHSSGQLAKD